MKTILRKLILVLSLALGLQTNVKAQLVFIPDSAFRAWLNINYGSCMVGDSIDPTCPDVLNTKSINVFNRGISDLTGFEVFVNDTLLNCSNNKLTWLPNFSSTLTALYCDFNLLTNLPALPSSLTTLECTYNQLTNLPALPSSLTNLGCRYNQLSSIPSLPSALKTLSCNYNYITSLPLLPSSLVNLYCTSNQLMSLPTLPSLLTHLECNYNQLASLPILPSSLTNLYCGNNQLTSLPTLPSFLKNLRCEDNQLTSLPSLSSAMNYLRCTTNQLTSLPTLPDTLIQLECGLNQLTSLPSLPVSLKYLYCSYNQIASLPTLSNYMINLRCDNNQITSLPTLPDSLSWLNCNDNPLTCLPYMNNTISVLDFRNTLINCVPNQRNISICNPSLYSFPICDIFNTNGCDVYWNIEGTTYVDRDTNCIKGINEIAYANQKVNLYKNGVLDQLTYTNINGNYDFDTFSNDVYKTELDTIGSPFAVNCPSTGFYLDTISATDSIKYDRDFALKCKGVDLAATSIYALNFRSTSLRTVNILAGDFTNFYGLNCSAGVSGTVTINITGACNYVSSPTYASTPTTAIGNVLTYSIADFGAISYDSTFDFNLLVDTAALLGSQICITVDVSTASSELNYTNNQLTQCFTVVGSYDPNDKTDYPTTTLDISGNKWLNYTIRFQNTGTAEAEHVYITDTMSNLVDISTFTLLSYSHQPLMQIYNDGLVKFNFPNIHLPDSNTNEPASHGYVQYKIRAKDSLVVGSKIDNKANIFFDFNAPVITNTVSNTVINCSLLQATITQNASTLETNLPNANYQWINCTTGSAIVGANTQTFNPTQSGNYAVIVDFGTCKDTSTCYYFSAVGINEIDASNISIQPNPFNNELKVTLDKSYEGVLEVYNTIGALITSEKLQSKNVTLNTSRWNAGVYILKVATSAGVVIKKAIKQ